MFLALETATAICSVALIDSGKVIAIREINEGFKHSEKLTVFTSEVVKEAGINLSDLKAVAVSAGPGSYTGLRIGVSVAKGLCYSLDIPLISISTLELMASGALSKIKNPDSDIFYCPMIDARRMEVYISLYDSNLTSVISPTAIVVDEEFLFDFRNNKKIYFFGDGAEKCKDVLKTAGNFIFQPDIFPSAKFMSEIAEKKFMEKQFEDIALFEPFYLKEFQPGVKKM
jgi:tRNA threonylcarbamoyladenosine biosynthesis protein TsaB